ncbi:MAG: zeta toxin family protein [Bacteroidia bacterium]|nr:zeta toxin family protein [Bacteroidia bacterium]
MPNLYIIAGCNGAGKTTASFTILPEMLKCYEFINADEIARGISPFNVEKAAIEAGKIMLKHIDQNLKEKNDFAVETTLSGKLHAKLVSKAKEHGYIVTLLFFWLDSPEMAKNRVQKRVLSGGHNIPSDVIERRYFAGLENFFTLFLPIVNNWYFVDSNSSEPEIIAKFNEGIIEINNSLVWNNLKSKYHGGE